MATGSASVSNPTSGTAGVIRIGEVITEQAFADLMASANSSVGVVLGSKTVKCLDVDGNGNASSSLGSGIIRAKGISISYASGSQTWIERNISSGAETGRIIQASTQTNDATATTVYTYTPVTNGVVHIVTRVVGVQSTYANAASYFFATQYVIAAGTPTIVGSASDLHAAQKTDAGWGDPAWSISGSNLLLKVTGKAGTIIDWTATIETLTVG